MKRPGPKRTKEGITAWERAATHRATIQGLVVEQGGFCAYCGRPMAPSHQRNDPHHATIDHLFPERLRGNSLISLELRTAVVAACQLCNQTKGRKNPLPWIISNCPPNAPIFRILKKLKGQGLRNGN